MVFDDEISVASSAVGTDLLANWEDQRVGYNRYLVGVGLVGANAVAQEVVSIRVGGKEVDRVRTQATGLGLTNTNMLAVRAKVPANALLQAVVLVAPTVSSARLRVVCVP